MTYDVILADPPWRYGFSRSKSREIERQYPTMTVTEIAALDVASLCAPDATLALWATMPKLREAFTVMDAWGFTYKTGAAWDKVLIGMGYYVRGRHELLLFGTRGNPTCPRPENRPDSIFAEKRRRHSQKPERAYRMLELMYPDATRLELFARSTRPGWDVWGNEVPCSIPALGAA
jgi:N6-adenosine-specific RNA methylase IME4